MNINIESPVGARTWINGKEFDYFSGTGYLGLQSHPDVVQAAQTALQQYGFATASSRGGFGEHPLYTWFEDQAQKYFKAEKVIHFPSGYLGAAILTQTSSQYFDHIFIDKDAHFSLWDAAQATNKPITPFPHLNSDRLSNLLKTELLPTERPLILTDGVFPISGEIAPLPEYLALVKPLNGLVYVDDAHAVGVLGPSGLGTPDYFGITDLSCRSSATLAKALGGYGGIIWGQAAWIDSIEQNSRICIGASPLPLPVVAASAKALEIAAQSDMLRQNLWQNVSQARQGLNSLGWDLPDTPVPVICLSAHANIRLERIQTGLYQQNIAVTLVRSYTSTPPGGALRIAIFASHTPDQIERLIEAIKCLL